MHLKKYALVCLPVDTVDRGLRLEDLGEVDVASAKKQHRRYCFALEHLGYTLVQIPPDNRYPDSVFVEDPAVIIQDTLIITRLRRKERQGEEIRLEHTLAPFFPRVLHIEEPGFIEGGDVLITDKRIYVGISGRTNAEGVEQLAKIARDRCGLPTSIIEIPKNWLHLKGEVTFHRNPGKSENGLITVSEEIASHFADSGYELVVTPREERFGGNSISGDGEIFVHGGRAQSKKLLRDAGFRIHELWMSEFEKIDGALSCLSKLFSVAE